MLVVDVHLRVVEMTCNDVWSFVHEVGIRRHNNGELDEEVHSIPLRYRRKSGLPIDEVLDTIIRHGYVPASTTVSDFIELLKAGKPQEQPLPRVYQKQPRCRTCGKFRSVFDEQNVGDARYDRCSECGSVRQLRLYTDNVWLSWRQFGGYPPPLAVSAEEEPPW